MICLSQPAGSHATDRALAGRRVGHPVAGTSSGEAPHVSVRLPQVGVMEQLSALPARAPTLRR